MPQTARWYFYVVRCADDTLYAGIATDVVARFLKHSTGVGAKYLRPQIKRPMQLVLVQESPTKSGAMSLEAHFKRWPRTRKIAFILGFGRGGIQNDG